MNGAVPSAEPISVCARGKATAPAIGAIDARVREREGDHAADAQRRRHGENEQHEDAAVDRAARRAAPEIGAHAGERRRPPAERVEREAGDEIDDAPQSRLGQRGEQRAEEDSSDRRSADLGEIGEQRRQRGESREREDERVQRRPPRQPADADQRQQLQRRLVHDEQHDDAADEHFRRKRRQQRNQAADLGHVPVGAEHDDELEQERHGGEAERLDRPQRARVAQQRRQRPAEIDAIGDRRVGDVEAQRVRPRSGQLPERKRVVALIGEQREGGGVDQQRRSRQGAEKGPPPQRQPRRAGEAGEDPFAGGQRRVDRRGDQRRAGRRRGQRMRAADRRPRRRSSRCPSLRKFPFFLFQVSAWRAESRNRACARQSTIIWIAARRAKS